MLRAEWMYDYYEKRSNYLMMILNAIHTQDSVSFSSKQFRGITYLKEVAENMDKVILLPGGAYNFGSETTQSIYEVTNKFVDMLGKRLIVKGTLLETVYEQCGTRSVARLVFTLEKTDPAVMDSIIHCMDSLGIPRENVSIINHTEAYLYFVLRQPKANFDNRALLLDWSGTQLSSYELNLIRSVNPPVIKATRQVLETSLSQDMMSNETHRRMVDSTIREHLERIIDHRGVSSLFVSGKAMENCQEWGKSFLNALAVGKKVRKGIFYESNVFAKGAVINANNELHGRNSYPYTIICEGRVGASMWMDTSVHGSKKVLMLAKEGSNWYDCRTTADLILDEASSIRLKIKKTGEKLTVFENISLDAFPKRPNKTTRVRLILTFTSEHTAMVRVQDLGFGEFFPSSGIVVKKEIKID